MKTLFSALLLTTTISCLHAAEELKALPSSDKKFGTVYCTQSLLPFPSETLSASLTDCHIIVSRVKNRYLGHFCIRGNSGIWDLGQQTQYYYRMLLAVHAQQQLAMHKRFMQKMSPCQTKNHSTVSNLIQHSDEKLA